jgi:hypothetical protein
MKQTYERNKARMLSICYEKIASRLIDENIINLDLTIKF